MSKEKTVTRYTAIIDIPKPSSLVFNQITHHVSQFWPEEFQGTSSSPGDEFVFRTGDEHYSKNKVVELEPGKKVVWLVTESVRKTDNFDWTGTKMIFELEPKDDNTKLHFTYDGIIPVNEYDRLVQVCNFVVEKLRNSICG